MLKQKTADVVARLKKVREDNGLSYQKIFDLVEKSGAYVSMSTIRKVFEDGSESYGFQYENTLKPIADVVLGMYEPSAEMSANEADAMKAIIEYKNEKIAELQNRLVELESAYKRRTDYLEQLLVQKEERLDRRDVMIERLVNALLRTRGGVDHGKRPRIETVRGADLPAEKPDR